MNIICDEKPDVMQDDIQRGKEEHIARIACLTLSQVVGQYLASLGERTATEECDAALVVRWGCTESPWLRVQHYLGQLCEEGRYCHLKCIYYALGRPGVAAESTASQKNLHSSWMKYTPEFCIHKRILHTSEHV